MTILFLLSKGRRIKKNTFQLAVVIGTSEQRLFAPFMKSGFMYSKLRQQFFTILGIVRKIALGADAIAVNGVTGRSRSKRNTWVERSHG